MKFLRHLALDLLLWFGMYHMVTDSIFTTYAYNVIAFILAVKSLLAVLVLIAYKEIKVTQIPTKAYAAYVDTTVLVETLVFAAFGFYWMAIANTFTWVVFGSLVRNKGKEQNAPQR